MSTWSGIGLSPELLAEVFPFHFGFDRSFRIVQAGASLHRHCPRLAASTNAREYLRIHRPEIPLEFDLIREKSRDLYVIEATERELILRGQMIYIQEQDSIVFVGSPWLTELGSLQKFGLMLDDFSLIDPVIDLLQVLQAQQSAFNDVKLFARKLTDQRADLREANRDLSALYSLSRILDESGDLENAAPKILGMICTLFEWKVAVLWLLNDNETILRGVSAWSVPGEQFDALQQYLHTLHVEPDCGLPGRVLSGEASAYISDVASFAPSSPYAEKLLQADLHSAFAFPLHFAGKTMGLCEFFSKEIALPDQGVMKMTAELGAKIGRFIERKKTEVALDRQDRLLRGVAEATGDLLISTNFNTSVQAVVESLGRTAEFDRVYIFQNYQSMNKGLCARCMVEWSIDGSVSDTEAKGTDLCYENIRHWYEDLAAGRNVAGLVRIFSEQEHAFVRTPKTKALLIVPILIEQEFWGFIGFDSFRDDYIWSANEVSTLQAMAASLGGAIVRRRSEDALRESRESYQGVFNNIKEVIFQADAHGHWTLLNPAWTEITGFSLEESMGKTCLEYVHPDDRQINYDLFMGLVTRKKEYCRHTLRYRTKNNSFRWIEAFARPTFDSHNELIGIAGTLTDVTERVRAEEETHNALERERELNELKSRFITTISHEFRTPLTAILSSAEILEHLSARLSEQQRTGHAHRIQDAAIRISSLLDDVLFMEHSNAGKLRFEPADIDIQLFCETVVNEVQTVTHYTHTIESSFAISCSTVRLDEKLLRQICMNLLSNAIKYSPAGTPVEFIVQCCADGIVLEIRDHGIGIPESEQSRLFEIFFRATNIGTVPGTGVGLTIVKQAVDLHGGTIEVQSAVGTGTAFRVHLPFSAYFMESV